MEKNSQISAQQLKDLAASPEGQRLIAMMQKDGGETARRAAEAYQSGDVAAAQALLQSVMQSREADDLRKAFGKR